MSRARASFSTEKVLKQLVQHLIFSRTSLAKRPKKGEPDKPYGMRIPSSLRRGPPGGAGGARNADKSYGVRMPSSLRRGLLGDVEGARNHINHRACEPLDPLPRFRISSERRARWATSMGGGGITKSEPEPCSPDYVMIDQRARRATSEGGGDNTSSPSS